LAGQMLLGGVSTPTLRNLIMIGVVLLLGGWLVDWLGVCPNVKRIWTPSWVLFSGGWCYLLLALFSIFTDLIGRSEWAYPLRAIGANSIMAYVGSHLVESFVIQSLKTHLGRMPFQIFGEPYEKITIGAIVLLGYVLVLIGMERRKIFIRI
jgi:predicted acyltransferase